jgi:hypothetical protein
MVAPIQKLSGQGHLHVSRTMVHCRAPGRSRIAAPKRSRIICQSRHAGSWSNEHDPPERFLARPSTSALPVPRGGGGGGGTYQPHQDHPALRFGVHPTAGSTRPKIAARLQQRQNGKCHGCAIRTPPVRYCKTAPPWGGTITQYRPKWIDHTIAHAGSPVATMVVVLDGPGILVTRGSGHRARFSCGDDWPVVGPAQAIVVVVPVQRFCRSSSSSQKSGGGARPPSDNNKMMFVVPEQVVVVVSILSGKSGSFPMA